MPKTTPSQEVSVERQEVAVQVDTTPLTLPGLYEQLQASEAGLTTVRCGTIKQGRPPKEVDDAQDPLDL